MNPWSRAPITGNQNYIRHENRPQSSWDTKPNFAKIEIHNLNVNDQKCKNNPSIYIRIFRLPFEHHNLSLGSSKNLRVRATYQGCINQFNMSSDS